LDTTVPLNYYRRAVMTYLRLLLGFTLLGLLALTPQRADAQSTGSQAAAEALFREGRRLMEEGNYDEACPKFEASNRLDVAVGTLLNLGVCWEQGGRLASAWATFLEAAALAARTGSPEREQLARSRAAELESRLIRVRVIVASPARGEQVTVGDRAFDDVMWSVAIPIDAGEWPVQATAPGRIPWEGTVTATNEGSVVELHVPALEVAPEPEVTELPPGLQQPVAPVIPEEPPNPARAAGWAVTAVGAATLGAGLGLGINARNVWNDANCAPDGDNYYCATSADQADAETARKRANMATGLLVAGGTVAIAGVILLIVSRGGDDEEEEATARVRVTPSVGREGMSLSVQGAF
jgi:hypothetical protein